MDPLTIGTGEVTIRVLAAAGLGALIGLERERRSQPAGLRTHALVAAGAALFTLTGAYGFGELPRSANVDPMRIAAQVGPESASSARARSSATACRSAG